MADVIATEIRLDIVTPDHLVAHDSVSGVTLPGKTGYLGILPGHAPLLTELAPGKLTYMRDGLPHGVCVTWGFAEVLPDRVIVLVQTAERAEDRLKRFADPQIDMERAHEALRRALARLETARHLQG